MMTSDSGADTGRQDNKAQAEQFGRETAAAGREALGELRHQAQAAAQQAGEQARAMAGDEKRAAAGEVHHVAEALRRSAEQFKDEDQPTLAGYVQQAAEGLDRFSRSLGDRSLEGMVSDLERFARRQPGLFLGGAVATGFLVTRFLKASAERDPAQTGGAYSGQGEALTPSQLSEPPRGYQPSHAGYPPHDDETPSRPAGTPSLGERSSLGATPVGERYSPGSTLGERHPPESNLGERHPPGGRQGEPAPSRPYPGQSPDPALQPRPEPSAGPRINPPKTPGGV